MSAQEARCHKRKATQKTHGFAAAADLHFLSHALARGIPPLRRMARARGRAHGAMAPRQASAKGARHKLILLSNSPA